MKLNTKAYGKMNYGLAIVGVGQEGQDQGCLINSLQQISYYPPKFSVTINKNNQTCNALMQAGSFAVTLVAKDADRDLLKDFGYKSGRVLAKFDGINCEKDSFGNPYLKEGMTAVISCQVTDQVDLGRYILFVAEAKGAELFQDSYPMTLEEFKDEGNTPPANATVYRTMDENEGFRCTVCGYICDKDELPADYKCPICRAPASKFEKR